MPAIYKDWLQRLPAIRGNVPLAYAIGLGLFVIACTLRWAIEGIWPDGLPYITFFIAVLLSTLFGGIGPGLTVLLASLVAAWSLWLPTKKPDQINASLVASVLFAINSGLIIYVVHLLNRTVERLLAAQDRAEHQLYLTAMAEQQLAQLNGELRHRNKNTFSILSSLVAQSARTETEVSTFALGLRSRLHAMGAAQDLMINTQYRGADLRLLVTETITPIIPPGADRVAISGPAFFMPADVATLLALVIHELATNCVKYGAWSSDTGRVSCAWRVAVNFDDDVGRRYRNPNGAALAPH